MGAFGIPLIWDKSTPVPCSKLCNMRSNRRHRVRLALLALLSLLFMQLSVAAYACAGLAAPLGGGSTPTMANEAMPDCEGMDAEQRALCHAHCHGQSATADVSVPPALALASIDLIGTAVFVASLQPVVEDDPTAPAVLSRATAPPIPIRNCCFRN